MQRTLRQLGWALLLCLPLTASQASDCTLRKGTIGPLNYRCDDGRSGSLRTDSLGNVRDSATGERWHKDSLGQWRSSEGKQWREDSNGQWRSKQGERWRKDSMGNWRSNDGGRCRQDSFGNWRCKGEQLAPPPVYQDNDDDD